MFKETSKLGHGFFKFSTLLYAKHDVQKLIDPMLKQTTQCKAKQSKA
jgi:hypothetical protein